MAKLTPPQRAALPASAFAGPGRSYPVNDAAHAEKALQLSPRGVAAGNITPAQKQGIDAKARRVLKSAPVTPAQGSAYLAKVAGRK